MRNAICALTLMLADNLQNGGRDNAYAPERVEQGGQFGYEYFSFNERPIQQALDEVSGLAAPDLHQDY